VPLEEGSGHAVVSRNIATEIRAGRDPKQAQAIAYSKARGDDASAPKAAGILFVSAAGNALFLKRGMTAPDFAGFWDFPGGGQEGDETAEETALREAREEIGAVPDGKRKFHTRTRPGTTPRPSPIDPAATTPAPPPIPNIDFTTFWQKVGNEFVPELDDEHVGYAWSPISDPPQPLHPGCQVALDRVGMDELGVARAIADGRLVSPQRYSNVWLFAIRLTGTGVAYRDKYDEFVHRAPENYLNEEFLARCNGLPVVFRPVRGDYDRESARTFHPKGATLDSEEFGNRIVGTVFLPYIDGDEVWGVAKIYDEPVARLMETEQLSTSPSVFFEDVSVNTKVVTDEGKVLLLEGKPSLLDHVCICPQGVWDKGGEPSGVRSETREDSAMNDKTKDDAAAGTQLDKFLSHCDAFGKRMDEFGKKMEDSSKRMDAACAKMDEFDKKEKEREDAKKRADEESEKAKADAAKRKDEEDEKAKADAAKKADEEKKAEDAKKADAARKDAAEPNGDPEKVAADKAKKDAAAMADAAAGRSMDDLQKQIAALSAKLPKAHTDEDYAAAVDAQARADEVFAMFGKPAPRPLEGETAPLYRRRVARLLREHSPTFKNVDVGSAAFADDAAFGPIEQVIYAEAKRTGASPASVGEGRLRAVTTRSGGHEFTDFHGDPGAWMNEFAGPIRQFATAIKDGDRRLM